MVKRLNTILLKLLVLAVLSAGAVQADNSRISARIKHGTTGSHQPYTGLLETDSFSCTATLIPNSACIITAGHCVAEDGESFFTLGEETALVEDLTSPAVRSNKRADIAIGKLTDTVTPQLASPISIGDQLPAFRLAETGYLLFPGSRVTVAGFGDVGSDDRLHSDELRSGTMLFGGYYSPARLGKDFISTSLQLVHDASEAAACSGDSGGPVFQGDRLVGIVSAGWIGEPPAFVCVSSNDTAARARTKGNRARRNPFKKYSCGAGCSDKDSGLTWGPILPRRKVKQYLDDMAIIMNLPGQSEHSYHTAEGFCSMLNSPEDFEQALVSKGIKRPHRYYKNLQKISQSRTNWRLPAAVELAGLSGANSFKRSKVRRALSTTIKTATYWAAGTGTASRRAVVDLISGDVSEMATGATSCDRQVVTEATSVAHYSTWIEQTLSKLGCYQ